MIIIIIISIYCIIIALLVVLQYTYTIVPQSPRSTSGFRKTKAIVTLHRQTTSLHSPKNVKSSLAFKAQGLVASATSELRRCWRGDERSLVRWPPTSTMSSRSGHVRRRAPEEGRSTKHGCSSFLYSIIYYTSSFLLLSFWPRCLRWAPPSITLRDPSNVQLFGRNVESFRAHVAQGRSNSQVPPVEDEKAQPTPNSSSIPYLFFARSIILQHPTPQKAPGRGIGPFSPTHRPMELTRHRRDQGADGHLSTETLPQGQSSQGVFHSLPARASLHCLSLSTVCGFGRF